MIVFDSCIILACTYLATRVMRKHVHYGGV